MSIFAKKSEPKLEPKLDVDIDLEVDRTHAGNGAPTPYGIADAMRLMRSLPVDQNIDLVVRVVRVTLSSVNVRIEDIVEDASRRQRAIQDNITALHETIADLEGQLEARRRDISAHEADLKETTSVKERLLLAEKGSNPGRQLTPSGNYNSSIQESQAAQPPPPPARATLPKPSQRE